MNNKEFIAALAARTGGNLKETQQKMDLLVKGMSAALSDEDSIMVSGFGTFETKKRMERVLVNPNSGQRMLVPHNEHRQHLCPERQEDSRHRR